MRTRTLLIVLLTCLFTIGLFAGDEINFTGKWTFNEAKSTLDEMGTQFLPAKLEIAQKGNDFAIARIYQREYEDDMVLEEQLTLDGKECKSEFWNSPRVSTANWSEDGKSLTIDTKITFERDGETSEMNQTNVFSLKEDGKILSIEHSSSSQWGERKVTMVFDKDEEAPKEE